MIKLAESAMMAETGKSCKEENVCSKCGSHNLDAEGICQDCGFKTECSGADGKPVATESNDPKNPEEPKVEPPAQLEADDFDYEGDLAYECPECKDVFTSDIKVNACECPNCGAEIEPNFLGEVEDVIDDETNEAFVKVTGGKKVKFNKKPKSGFKRVNGKYVKMSSKEINARKKSAKKASKKANTSTAKRKRAKSMNKRQTLVANFQLENALLVDVLNTAIESVYESIKDQYHVPAVESIENPQICEGDLVIDANIKYDDGVTESVQVTVKNFNESTGDYALESVDLFGQTHEVTVGLSVAEGLVEPTKLDYNVTMGESVIKGGVVVE